MRRFAAVVVVLVATLLGVPSVASASAASRDYVALGDSYSSGVGTRTYFPDSGVCARSPLAYPSLYRATHRISSFAFVACAGATVADVTGQLSAVTRQTDLVTMTVGGNDVGFGAVLAACSAPPRSPEQCQAAVAAGQAAISTIPARVTGLLANIQARVNPGTEVVVLGYPRLFGAGPCTAPGLPISSIRNAIDDGTDRLNQAISEAAQTHGALFVDVSSKFAGHGACAESKSQWINPPTAPFSEAYHPNIRGHALGYLPALDAACAVRPSPPNTLRDTAKQPPLTRSTGMTASVACSTSIGRWPRTDFTTTIVHTGHSAKPPPYDHSPGDDEQGGHRPTARPTRAGCSTSISTSREPAFRR